jgi:1-acyl-sn-glycerol-3-phosphate acyltransferase
VGVSWVREPVDRLFPRYSRIAYRVLKLIIGAVLRRLYRVRVEGLEHVPRDGAAVVAANHISFLDSFFIPLVVPRRVTYLAKSEYWERWRTRWFFDVTGQIPVHRKDSEKAQAALEAGLKVLNADGLLGIYPEGTRSPDGRLYRGKTGPVRLALRTGAPVIPVAMVGTLEVLPPGTSRPRLSRVGVRIGPPIDFAARYGSDDRDHFALRSATDELMYEIMLLSGQEYVDEYASKVKSGEVIIGSGDLEELGRQLDEQQAAA